MSQHMNDAMILDQLRDEWQKIAAVLLWKLKGREKVTLTGADFEAYAREFEPGIPCLYTHGHKDSIDFQIVDEPTARRHAAQDRSQRGHS